MPELLDFNQFCERKAVAEMEEYKRRKVGVGVGWEWPPPPGCVILLTLAVPGL